MVHIRLSETTHRSLKVLVAQQGTTIQELVENLIESKLAVSRPESPQGDGK